MLTREAGIDPRVSENAPILQDYVSILDPRGVERRRISLLDAYDAAGAEHDWRAALRALRIEVEVLSARNDRSIFSPDLPDILCIWIENKGNNAGRDTEDNPGKAR